MNWSARYAREVIYKQAHFEGIAHPVPGSLEEVINHCKLHHPELKGKALRDMASEASHKYPNIDDPRLHAYIIDYHVKTTHPNGTRAGDHPHVHGEETNIEVPDTVDAISTNYV